MKRSRSLSIMLMSSLSLGLAGCGDEPVKEEFQTFNSLGDCVQSGEFTAQQCQSMADEARKQTPKFASKEECEKAFGVGACETEQTAAASQGGEPTQGGATLSDGTYRSGSSWMPLMAGYMMGRYMSGGTAMQGAQPLFRGPEQQQQGAAGTTTTTSRIYRTAGGETVRTDPSGRVANPSSSIRQGFAQSAKPFNARTMTTSRGGFGGSSKFGGSVGS